MHPRKNRTEVARADAEELLDGLLERGLAGILDDKEIRQACLHQMSEAGLKAPANHIFMFALRKFLQAAENFVLDALKSKLLDVIVSYPPMASFLQGLSELQSANRERNALKAEMLKGLGEQPDQRLRADMQSEFETISALYSKRKFERLDASIAGLGNTLIASIETLLRDMTAPQLLTAGYGGTWEQASPKQSLTQRLKYNSGLFGFHGRERELQLLADFLVEPAESHASDMFSWLLLTAPGGEGKSRLALEFCKNHLPAGWLGGKLELGELRKMVHGQFRWHPRQPTLFVVDYPAQDPDSVFALLKDLRRNHLNFDLPVRVLLLERDKGGNWFQQLLPESSEADSVRHHAFRKLHEGEMVWPLGPDAITTIMSERFTAPTQRPPSDLLLQAAHRVDGRATQPVDPALDAPETWRPRALFAVAVAELLAANPHQTSDAISELAAALDREQVLQRILDRERSQRWHPAASSATALTQHARLFGFATMCLGLPFNELDNPALASLRGPVLPGDLENALLDSMAGQHAAPLLPALEPDILGEFFALDVLLQMTPKGRQGLIDAAFSIGEDNFGVFCLRCYSDFPDKARAADLSSPSEQVPLNAARAFAGLAIDLLHFYGSDTRWAFDLMARLATISRLFHDDVLCLRESMAAANLINHASEVSDWERVDRLLDRIDTLRKVFPNNQEIAQQEALAAANATSNANISGDWERTDRMFDRIDTLRKGFPENQEIARHEAGAAANVISDAGKAGDWERVDRILDRIDTLRRGFPENKGIARHAAMAAFNATSDAGKAGNWERVDRMLDRIDILRNGFPESQEIVQLAGMAAVNVTGDAGKAADWERVDRMLDRIDTLRSGFPENREIARHEAMAAVNVISNAGKSGGRERVDRMLDRIDTLRNGSPKDQEIARQEAKAAVNVTRDAGNAGDWERVDLMLDRIHALRNGFPEDQEIARLEAGAAVNVTNNAGRAGGWERVDRMLQRIDNLRRGFPEDQELAQQEAMVAFNVTMHAGNAGDWERVDQMRTRIRTLERFQNHAETTAICALTIAWAYYSRSSHGVAISADSAGEAAAAADTATTSQATRRIGLGVCLQVVKEVRHRLPENDAVGQIYLAHAQRGIDWHRVPRIKPVT